MTASLISQLAQDTPSKILLLVADGLGDLPYGHHDTPLTEAKTPNLDRLAHDGELGTLIPITPGITPGSGPGHLALFGYDPVTNNVGRGLLSALGLDFDILSGDLAIRINFATVTPDKTVTDRRAGRIPTAENERLCHIIQERVTPPVGYNFFMIPESEHRALGVLRGEGLSDAIQETDPQKVGAKCLPPAPLNESARITSKVLTNITDQIFTAIKNEPLANGVLMRGFSTYQTLPTFREIYKLNATAICEYPMYRGLAKLVGMTAMPRYHTLADGIEKLKETWETHHFFFFHYKKTDSAGEDGNFEAKVAAIETLDQSIPEMMALNPDVFIVTGDHSTPCALKAHSWHPIPFLIHSAYTRESHTTFNEATCQTGTWNGIRSTDLMPLMLANARKLQKYGA